MSEKKIIALPSNTPGGLKSEMSEHFGHCEVFTLITLVDGAIKEISLLPNLPHEQGGCMAPVNYLKENGVNVLIAGGMGARPFLGFDSVGIRVYHNSGIMLVEEAMAAFLVNQLPEFQKNDVCGGGGNHH